MQPLRWTDAQRTEFATRMRQARERAGLSQKDAAEAIGIKQPTLSELEKSATKSAHTAVAARVYRVSPVWLQSGEGPMASADGDFSPRAAYLAAELDSITNAEEFERACLMCEALVSLAKAGQLVAFLAAGNSLPPGAQATRKPLADRPSPRADSRTKRT